MKYLKHTGLRILLLENINNGKLLNDLHDFKKKQHAKTWMHRNVQILYERRICMLLNPEEVRAHDGNLYLYSEKIRKLNDGETEFWIDDFHLNLFASGCAAEIEFENGEVIIHSAGALIRISLEKEKMVCDGKELHNRIISWMGYDAQWIYELNQDIKAKKHVIL